MKNVPPEIYLDIGTGLDSVDDFNDLYEVSWSADNATGHGIHYTRPTSALILELRQQIKATVMDLVAGSPEGEIADTLDSGLDAALGRLLPATQPDEVLGAVLRVVAEIERSEAYLQGMSSVSHDDLHALLDHFMEQNDATNSAN